MVVWPLYDTTVEETTDLSLISQDNQTCSFDQLPIGEIVICGREKKDANNKMYELWRRNKKNTSMNVNLQPILTIVFLWRKTVTVLVGNSSKENTVTEFSAEWYLIQVLNKVHQNIITQQID